MSTTEASRKSADIATQRVKSTRKCALAATKKITSIIELAKKRSVGRRPVSTQTRAPILKRSLSISTLAIPDSTPRTKSVPAKKARVSTSKKTAKPKPKPKAVRRTNNSTVARKPVKRSTTKSRNPGVRGSKSSPRKVASGKRPVGRPRKVECNSRNVRYTPRKSVKTAVRKSVKNPRKSAKSPRKNAKSPRKTAKSPRKAAKSPRKVASKRAKVVKVAKKSSVTKTTRPRIATKAAKPTQESSVAASSVTESSN